MEMEHSNPYADFGGTVTGERFIGRAAELRTLESRVFGPAGFGSIAVVGLPRIGKTSLVSEAIRRAEPRAAELRSVAVRVDVGAFSSVDGLFRSLVEELVGAVRGRGLGNELVESRVERALAAQQIGFGEVRAVFKALRQAGVRPVCVLDEFDAGRRVFEDTPQCFHWLRELCSSPEFKAAVVLIAKRHLQDVARLAGYQSDYWANVLMSLPLRPLVDSEVGGFFATLAAAGVAFQETERAEVLSLCGGHPFLLDAFAYHAWEHVNQGRQVDLPWIAGTCGRLVRDYLQQVSSVLGDGPMLSKAVQVLVGPRWDVTSDEVDALCDLGVVLQDENGKLRGFSRTFEDHLRVVERTIDIWPLWRDTERALREVLESRLEQAFGAAWPEALIKARPKLKAVIDGCVDKRDREQKRFGTSAASSLLAYTYPMDLYQLMGADWAKLGEPLLGRDKQAWAVKFDVLSKVRTPLAHNREETVDDGERTQAEGICREILERYRQLDGSASA
jgi:hypothetical protein